ncbi:PLP-dependent transferase [Acidaminobacter sp. JC074]|uniref:trans-sulfuration enzyme family protein n=1 Tax=Acidaminobacter sp. JC074 TaxID=2530199 RepID=UPI001F112BF4|nr:PLP-dependent aspartate aminotransferase family protein [Acidaminobacter sp. JC074]MCH4887072.1 PLP-dependent transferase [Acidaminobacter sp. JC074]
MRPSTIIAHHGEDRKDYHGAVVPPIFQNSLFTFENADAIDHAFSNVEDAYIYTRGNNPTVTILEEKVAALEHGEACKFFSSGMSAISSAILHFVNAGDHVICIDSVYGPTSNFLSEYLGKKFKIEIDFIKGGLDEIIEKTRHNTSLIYLESPSSGIYACQDLKAIADYARDKGIGTVVDNTWASPIFQNPLKLGIDIVVHSASKYLCGHSDVVAGCAVSSRKIIKEMFMGEHQFLGSKISPFEAWLILRGLRTLPIRMERHQSSTRKVLDYLGSHPKVLEILYPDKDPIALKQMKGFSGLFSVVLDTDGQGARDFIDCLNYFSIGFSWGGFESLAYAPIISLSKELPPDKLKAAGIHPGLIRLFAGLEDPEDLIEDLKQALDKI